MSSITSTQNLITTLPAALGRAYVVVLTGQQATRVELPENGRVVIGRDEGNAIFLDDSTVSRNHAELVSRADGSVEVRDLGSRNGTRVRGALVQGSFPLNSGDLVEIGRSSLFIERVGAGADDSARFERSLQQECARSRSAGTATGLWALSIPGATLEQLRAAVAGALCAEVVAGRFAVILSGADLEAVVAQAEKLEAGLRADFPSLRAGLAISPRDGSTSDELTSAARATLDQRPAIAPTLSRATSAAMREVYEMVARIAPADLPVLVTGETGSGKQVVAEMIHAQSKRSANRFVRINCAALPEPLLEAELFGFEKGAFTGALKEKTGLFEHASGGTLMLDEIGDMPLAMQAKLLQVLEERVVRRIGAVQTRPVDIRLIAATNRDLATLSESGVFRADLYWRLNGATLTVPPLRERGDEVVALAHQFLRSYALSLERPVPRLSPDAAVALTTYPWPGNVRQLRSVMERAVLMATGGVVTLDLLPSAPVASAAAQPPPYFSEPHRAPVPTAPRAAPREPVRDTAPHSAANMRSELAALERERILDALAQTNNNQTRAAELLGIPRRTFLEKLDRHQIARPRKGTVPSG